MKNKQSHSPTAPQSQGLLHRVVRGLAWLFVWLTRIMIGNLAIAFAALVAYKAYQDWPAPLYALGFIVAILAVSLGTHFLYDWCKKQIDP